MRRRVLTPDLPLEDDRPFWKEKRLKTHRLKRTDPKHISPWRERGNKYYYYSVVRDLERERDVFKALFRETTRKSSKTRKERERELASSRTFVFLTQKCSVVFRAWWEKEDLLFFVVFWGAKGFLAFFCWISDSVWCIVVFWRELNMYGLHPFIFFTTVWTPTRKKVWSKKIISRTTRIFIRSILAPWLNTRSSRERILFALVFSTNWSRTIPDHHLLEEERYFGQFCSVCFGQLCWLRGQKQKRGYYIIVPFLLL